jgi:predicted membrane protein
MQNSLRLTFIKPNLKPKMSRPMSLFSSATFWGAIIVLLGLSIILKAVFHINIPLVRIVFGILLIYWGIKMISGGFGKRWSSNDVIFNEGSARYDDDKNDYNIIFGNGVVDLFKAETPAQKRKIDVNVVFGNGRLILNDSIPAKVKMTAVFGSAEAPDKSSNGFGESTFTTSTFSENAPYILIDATAVFGKLELESRKW